MNKSFLQSQRYTRRVVDRIGGGDSFAASLIYGFDNGRDSEATVKCAVAAGALRHRYQKLNGSLAAIPAGGCSARSVV